MVAEIVTIGDEILIGQIIDTNSAWIGEKLNSIGIRVNRIISVSDEISSIGNAVLDSLKTSDIVIITGGLGPTNDDITKGVLLDFFGGNMVEHQPTLQHIEQIFYKRGLPLTALNRKQSEVPDSCLVLSNINGTAPGMWFEKNNKVLIALPGVPFEMKSIMENEVLPRLKTISKEVIIHKTIQTFGLPESFLAEKIAGWERSFPANIKLAYLPSPTSIRLRISAYGNSEFILMNQITNLIISLKQLIPKYIFGYNEQSLQEVVGLMLKKINANVSTAESCTGGTIAHLITQVPGSSFYFLGGIVAYSNQIKIEQLGVDINILNHLGAVSQEVVEQMAKGVLHKFKTNYGIAISGIAGPEGGTLEKPVGTVWICVVSQNNMITKKVTFGNERQINILRSSATALNMLRLLILKEHPKLNENIFAEKFE